MQTFDASSRARSLWPTHVFRILDRELGDYFVIGSTATELQDRTAALDGPNASGVRYQVADVRVDVIPYGQIEQVNLVEPAEGVVLDVTGMRDAAATSVAVTVDHDLVVRFASLPAMIALKLVAWGMRRGHTSKDAEDLGLLIDASQAGPFEEACWTDEAAAARWDYEPALVGPYRMGLDLAGSFSEACLLRLVQLLNGEDLARLAAQLPKRALPRMEQLDALAAGLTHGRHG